MYDEYNDEEIVLSKEEMRMIQRIRQGAPLIALLWEWTESGYLLWAFWTCCCMAAAGRSAAPLRWLQHVCCPLELLPLSVLLLPPCDAAAA